MGNGGLMPGGGKPAVHTTASSVHLATCFVAIYFSCIVSPLYMSIAQMLFAQLLVDQTSTRCVGLESCLRIELQPR